MRKSLARAPSTPHNLGDSMRDMTGQRLEGDQQGDFNRTVAELQELVLGRNVQTELSLPELLDLTVNYVQRHTQHRDIPGIDDTDGAGFPEDWIGDLVFLLSATGQIMKSTAACRRTLGRLQRVQADASIIPVTVDGQPGALFSAICTHPNQPLNPRGQELSIVPGSQGPTPPTYRGFFIHTPDFHVVAAFSGHTNQTLFGRPSAYWVSESPYTHIHAEDVQVVRDLHTETVQSGEAVMLYNRVHHGHQGWSMCENLLLPCINYNTGQVQFLASTTWLQEEGSSSVATRISESKRLSETEPIFFGTLGELTDRFSQMAMKARDAHAANLVALESSEEAKIMEEFMKTKLQAPRIRVSTDERPKPDIILPHNFMSQDKATTPAGLAPIPEGVMNVLAALPPDQINSGIVHALRSYGLVPHTNSDGTITAQTFPVPGVDILLPGQDADGNGGVTSTPEPKMQISPDQRKTQAHANIQPHQNPNFAHSNSTSRLNSSNANQFNTNLWGPNQIQNGPPNASSQSNGSFAMEADHMIPQPQQGPEFGNLGPLSVRETEMMAAIQRHLFMMGDTDRMN